jgi:glycerol uptake facilitator-like aquaporin
MFHIKKYLTEFVATGLFALVIALSAFNPAFIAAPLVAGTTLALFVYIFGSISGTHINPAVTLGLLSIRKISLRDAIWYIIAQTAGALSALVIGRIFQPAIGSLPTQSLSLAVGFAEFAGAIVFGIGIAAVVYGKISNTLSGLVIGGSLLVGIAIAASAASLGILNPAVALTLGALSLPYIIGPVLGMIVGMQFYKWIIHVKDSEIIK